MSWDHLQLKPQIISAVQRAQLKSVREILCVSGPDLQKRTGLSRSDVQELLHAAATASRTHQPVTALQLQRGECHRLESGLRLGTGCPVLDQLLRGGLPVGGVTELSGESGAGKTQLGLQLCLSVQYPVEHRGLSSGALYVCTEDPFPIKRLQQLISEQSVLRSDVPRSLISGLQLTGVFVFRTLCRCEFQPDDWLERNKQLLTFSSMLHNLSQEFTTPILCINQVTDVFNQSANSLSSPSSSVCPALGLAWANQVMVRLMMRRLQGKVFLGDQSSALRRLEVVFAPHLARNSRDIGVWREGLRAVLDPD
ncbi:DNA repair protein XRCC3 isoform X2 [Girardinichthys multiradiatus]|uniref:DNA repair protein XRCC3 isoform X2 n=1 Tax=Girardinichthys multiradiatus TaxID=208333 RepID=UPI001FADF68B|nr:DNA repair protein XRCC3 isoform X2 [Girardinichthys multiradiatus]